MKRNIKFLSVSMVLFLICFAFISCSDGSCSGSDDPTPPDNVWNGPIQMDGIWTSGILPGLFSVNQNKQVHFSQGNLYWDGDGRSFKMEEYQYKTASSWNKSHISHFLWCSTAEEARDENYRSSGNTFFAADGGAIRGWGVLSSDEWEYLFNTRTGAAEKVGYGIVCGVNGIILLPDVFTDPMKNNGDGAFIPKATTDWKTNIYTSDNWAAMEEEGAVFLPAAGKRRGSSVYDVGYYGNYWSSTPYMGTVITLGGYELYFKNNYINFINDYGSCGFAVRLVRFELNLQPRPLPLP